MQHISDIHESSQENRDLQRKQVQGRSVYHSLVCSVRVPVRYDFEVEDLRRTKRNPRKNLKQYQVWSQYYPLLPRNLDDEEEEVGRDRVTRDLQREQ